MLGIVQPLTELETYVSLLRLRRQEVSAVLRGVSPEGLNWLPVQHASGQPKVSNSLYQLANHCIVTEADWRRHIAFRIGALSAEELAAQVEHGDLEVSGDDPAPLLGRILRDGDVTDRLIVSLTHAQLDLTWLNARGERRGVRWIIGHLIAHYGEHIGQMALTRQLWEAGRQMDPRLTLQSGDATGRLTERG
ncbi:MAG: DUF664 domain-containing protein [Anaerolineae bacterium]|nr:DUF664 domain-containing protein [Anaerolineae bacterium]